MIGNRCVIFGGTGFIGSHFAIYLLKNGLYSEVVLVDIAPPRADFDFSGLSVRYVPLDVRTQPDLWELPTQVDLIANFAAVHREPGHDLNEYYETNIPGAEHVCAYASMIGCDSIIFTSSIAPYGPSESVKSEKTIPTPVSGYGGSKLVAEKIHIAWKVVSTSRKLVIVRPGVVFGPGERGNVTRLMQATLRRYFLYMGNRDTRKAGGYVKELVSTMAWALDRASSEGGFLLYNFTVPTPPTVEDYVRSVCKVANVSRRVPSLPYGFLLFLSHILEFLAKPFGMKIPISPVRIRKLVKSNNIEPIVLLEKGYGYQFTLESAMADWFKDRPAEWR